MHPVATKALMMYDSIHHERKSAPIEGESVKEPSLQASARLLEI